MERRTVFLIVGLLVAFASLGGAFCVWAWGPDSLEEKLEQIHQQRKFTKSEVEAILGKPSSYTESGMPVWSNDRIRIGATYDDHGKLIQMTWTERVPLWDRIRKRYRGDRRDPSR